MMVRPKHQRLVLIILAAAALLGAVLLAMWGLQDRAAYFVTPSDIAAGKTTPDKAMRLGGMVEKGTLKRDTDGLTIRFTVSDTKARTQVVYRGIAPDLRQLDRDCAIQKDAKKKAACVQEMDDYYAGVVRRGRTRARSCCPPH